MAHPVLVKNYYTISKRMINSEATFFFLIIQFTLPSTWGSFIGNLAYFITEILINTELLEKVRSFRIYHAFPNSLVIFDKNFFTCTI